MMLNLPPNQVTCRHAQITINLQQRIPQKSDDDKMLYEFNLYI